MCVGGGGGGGGGGSGGDGGGGVVVVVVVVVVCTFMHARLNIFSHLLQLVLFNIRQHYCENQFAESTERS